MSSTRSILITLYWVVTGLVFVSALALLLVLVALNQREAP